MSRKELASSDEEVPPPMNTQTAASAAARELGAEVWEFSMLAVLQPLSIGEFRDHYWGKRPYFGAVADDFLEELQEGFSDGAIADVLRQCRKDDNRRYTPSEMENLMSDFDEGRKTLNLPYCCTPGAELLRNSFIHHLGDLGNDIEVGVYVSQSGGETTGWHYDNNHNITIQMGGEKEWRIARGSSHTVMARGLFEPARSRYEQAIPTPQVGEEDVECHNLRPGSIVYLPPGYWHAVAATGPEISFSVDIRVGNVLQSKWICEALFSGLLAQFHSPAPSADVQGEPALGVGPADLGDGTGSASKPDLSASVQRQLQYIASKGSELVQRCRLPRCFPFQSEYCDGIHRGGTLQFLADRGFSCSSIDMSGMVGVNDLVAMTLKRRDNTTLIIQMFSESVLTTMEYFRYSLYCEDSHFERMRRLRDEGCVSLISLFEGLPVGSIVDDSTPYNAFHRLLRVLLHGNILYWRPKSPNSGAGKGPTAGQKRPKTAS